MGKREIRQQKSSIPLFCRFYLTDFFFFFFPCEALAFDTSNLCYFWSLCSSAELPLGAESYLRERVLWVPSVCLWEECFCPPGILCWSNELQFGRTVYHCSEGQTCVKITRSAARQRQNWDRCSKIEVEWVLNKGRLMFNCVIMLDLYLLHHCT